MKSNNRGKISLILLIAAFSLFAMSCDQLSTFDEHEVVFEENVHLLGTTSSEGFVDLMDYEFWRDNKYRIEDITDIKIEYIITENNSPTDVYADFYFGENYPNVYLGTVFIAQGATNPTFIEVSLESSKWDLIDLIMNNDAFWYSVQGNTETADIVFHPVRGTIYGTFNIL